MIDRREQRPLDVAAKTLGVGVCPVAGVDPLEQAKRITLATV
jgi:hypothetical protein